MRNLRSFLLPVAAGIFLAADNIGLGNQDPTLTKPVTPPRYKRTSDDAIVKAERYTNEGELVPGMFAATDADPTPYVITKTGMHEPVGIGDYVITESDGEHYYAYPASKFEQEYVAAPLDSSSPADLPDSTHDISAAEATPKPATDLLPTNTAFLQAGDGTLTPLGTTTGSEPRVVDADVAASTGATVVTNSTASVPAATPGTPNLQDQLDAKDRKIAELDAWNKTASDAFDSLDSYLHSVNEDLPEHYGMPVDGVKATIEKLRVQSSPDLTKGLANPGLHTPASPDAPSADEAAGALSTLLEHFPKLYAGIVEPVKEMRHSSTLTIAMKAKINAAIGVIEKRFSNV